MKYKFKLKLKEIMVNQLLIKYFVTKISVIKTEEKKKPKTNHKITIKHVHINIYTFLCFNILMKEEVEENGFKLVSTCLR